MGDCLGGGNPRMGGGELEGAGDGEGEGEYDQNTI
jgi:hypothetical protein